MNFPSGINNHEKCNVTYGVMGLLDPKQPPVKRKPYSAILNQKFIQRIELIIPEELYAITTKAILTENSSPEYSRVILPLEKLLEGDFFNEYIKKGNILMLSEGRIGVDNVYLLKDGKLWLHLSRESYERAGLVGKPDGIKGNRGIKPRWVVEIDLRLPSMLHGKKGFDRIVYAFKNVLNIPVTWLFCDLGTTCLNPDPLEKYFPIRKTSMPDVTQEMTVAMPSLMPPTEIGQEYDTDFQDYAIEIHEWFSLVMLKSPCINHINEIDPILSRYSAPGDTSETKLVKVVWQGFISPSWAHKLFVKLRLAFPPNAWFALDISGFPEGLMDESSNCMILKLPNGHKEYVLWEIR